MNLVPGYSSTALTPSYSTALTPSYVNLTQVTPSQVPEMLTTESMIERHIATRPPKLTTKVNMRREGKSELSTNEVLSSGREFDERYEFFIEQTEPFNINILNDDGNTALGTAILNDDVSMIYWLLKNGIDPNLGKFDILKKVLYSGIQIYGSYENIADLMESLIFAGKIVELRHLERAVEIGNGLLIRILLDQNTYFNNDGSLKKNTNLPQNIRYLIEISKNTSKRTWGNYFYTFNPIKISRTLTNKNKSEISKLVLRKPYTDALYTGDFNPTPEGYRDLPQLSLSNVSHTAATRKAIEKQITKGGKHHKTHHRKRRTLRKKQTKTRRHHRK